LSSQGPYDRSEGKLNPQTLGVPAHNECRNDGLITTGRGPEKIDDRDLCRVYRYQPGLSADPDPEPRGIGGTKEDAGMGADRLTIRSMLLAGRKPKPSDRIEAALSRTDRT
jgi:hypothetical protein